MVLSDVFISYSRKDSKFVDSLNKALMKAGKNVWVDWEDIPYSSKWWDEISKAVEGTSTFICVLSPDNFSSKTCLDELNLAESHNKRIIPTLHKEFDEKLNSMRLLVRAIEWKNKKNDSSYHLYGKDLEEAESLAKKESKMLPPLNILQHNYIEASRSGATHLQRKQLRGFYVAALIYSIAQIFVIYFWSFNSISETGMINLSWVWLPGLSFAIAGFTIGKYSIRKSFIAMAIIMVLFFLFFTILWESL